ncbi:hypothetical protein SBV1_1450057 [Verrucomicrobia bacterium]|nr:hypothetical protein SBV1_1450057 [Verrucomicrobiota bacterium]
MSYLNEDDENHSAARVTAGIALNRANSAHLSQRHRFLAVFLGGVTHGPRWVHERNSQKPY